jgi:hypothetical protein
MTSWTISRFADLITPSPVLRITHLPVLIDRSARVKICVTAAANTPRQVQFGLKPTW